MGSLLQEVRESYSKGAKKGKMKAQTMFYGEEKPFIKHKVKPSSKGKEENNKKAKKKGKKKVFFSNKGVRGKYKGIFW